MLTDGRASVVPSCSLWRVLLAAAALVFTVPANVSAQSTLDEARGGIYVGLGLGNGWLDVSTATAVSYRPSLAATLRLGGALSDRWLLGLESSAWVDGDGQGEVSHGNLLGVVSHYPLPDRPLIVRGGAGFAQLEARESSSSSAQVDGWSVMLGVGYGIYLGGSFALEPYFEVVRGNYDGGSSTLLHAGLSLIRY